MKIGRITVSDRAHSGVYEDASGPEIQHVLAEFLTGENLFITRNVPDEIEPISEALLALTDQEKCELVVTTGGTGVGKRDVTPEATRLVIERELPGFGEIMRMRSYEIVRTAILSRALAGTRGQSLVINLPGKPSAVRECLEILQPAIIEGLGHLRGEPLH